MQWLLLVIIGWCGTGWPRHIFVGSGSGGGFDPDDIWPRHCPACFRAIGSLSAVLIFPLVSNLVADAGFWGLAAVAFAAGSFGSGLVGGVAGMALGKR